MSLKRWNFSASRGISGGATPVSNRIAARAEPSGVGNTPSTLWKLAQTLCRIFTTCWFDLKVYGVRYVPRRGGVLLVCNHQSYLDPMLIGVRLNRPLSYVAKAELFENRYFARLLRWLNAFPVRQGSGDVGAVKQTIARLKEGRALAIFPEGSRTDHGDLLPVQRGVGLVLRRARVPAVPVVIDGSFQAWPLWKKLFRPSNIRLVYGPPMELSDLKDEQIVQRIEATLREMFAKLRESDRQ